MTDWQPMSTAPRDGTRVLVAFEGYPFPRIVRWAYDSWWFGVSAFVDTVALGWQPLPPMPEGPVQGGAE